MDNNKPLVSVITACFNDYKYISECVESVQKSIYPNIEHIIIDDGSTCEKTKRVLSDISNISNVTVLTTPNNGVCEARNIAISRSNGVYILPLDSDDIISDSYIELAVAEFESNSNLSLVATNYKLIGNASGSVILEPYRLGRLLGHNLWVNCSMFKRSEFDAIGGYNANMNKGYEDWDMWIALMKQGGEVKYLDGFHFFYRIKDASESRNFDAVKNADALRRQMWENHKELYSQHFVDPKEYVEYISKSLELTWELKSLNKKELSKVFRRSFKILLKNNFRWVFKIAPAKVCGFFAAIRSSTYRFNTARYQGTFLANQSVEPTMEIGQAEKVVYSFWTGSNEIPQNRRESIRNNNDILGVKYIVVTKDTLAQYILPDAPLHPAFEYLSDVHKSDYLRCYFMHHYGGGYIDVKKATSSWDKIFDKLNASSKDICGYKEIGTAGLARVEDVIFKDLKKHWRLAIGNGAYIFKSHTPFSYDWYQELHRRMDFYSEDLRKNPGNVYGDNVGYPIPWTNILGDIVHPLCLKHYKSFMYSDRLFPICKDYR